MSSEKAAKYIINDCIIKKKRAYSGRNSSIISKLLKFFPNIVDFMITIFIEFTTQ